MDGTIKEADLAEDLIVDREMYECVKSFCYLGDTEILLQQLESEMGG